MEFLSKLKQMPAWGWAVIGTVVGVLGVVFLRRPSASVSIAPSAVPQSAEPAPPSGAGFGPSLDLSPLLTAFGRLGEQQATTNAGLAQLGRQTAQATEALIGQQASMNKALASIGTARAMTVIMPSGDVPAAGRTVAAATNPKDAVAVTPVATAQQLGTVERTVLSIWVDDEKNAGYVTASVSLHPDSPAYMYERGIYDAKSWFSEAENSGDKAAMDKAHADAERWRLKAKQDGIELPDWAKK